MTRVYPGPVQLLVKLPGKIVLDAHLGDLVLLRFDPVDMLFLLSQDRLQQIVRPVVDLPQPLSPTRPNVSPR